MKCLWVGARAATILLDDSAFYRIEEPYTLLLNGKPADTAATAVVSLYDLEPESDYTLTLLCDCKVSDSIAWTTAPESVTLDVRAFGAGGDGETDDTAAIQAALSCCPYHGRVLIPAGTYCVFPLFLKSHISVELAQGATLLLATERARFAVLPAFLPAARGGKLPLGTWEGEPQPMYAALLNSIGIQDTAVYGRGLLDGQARRGGWWIDPKRMNGARRGRMVFLSHCKNITVQGLTIQNSPSWNVHPHYSDHLRFLCLAVHAPADSPNTDGINPESCADVLIAGVHFSLGDDCIAVKAGKAWMGQNDPKPCERIEIAHCLMENGHGGVTVGSEMSGSVREVTVRRCRMVNTDRGLRVKTRRGRGGSIDRIRLEHIRMERVGVPLTVNAFYACDADGLSPAVQDRAPRPVDGGTPAVGSLSLYDVEALDCGACACYLLGLPEKKIEAVALEQVHVSYRGDAPPFFPVMAGGVLPCLGQGIIAENVEKLTLTNVRLEGAKGEALQTSNVERVEGGVSP